MTCMSLMMMMMMMMMISRMMRKSQFFTNIHTGTLVDNMYRRTKLRLITSHCLNERRILTLHLGW